MCVLCNVFITPLSSRGEMIYVIALLLILAFEYTARTMYKEMSDFPNKVRKNK